MSKLRERVLAELFAERDAEIARLRTELAAVSERADRAEQERDKLLTIEADTLRETHWVRQGYDRGRRDAEERVRELEAQVRRLTAERDEEGDVRERLAQLLAHTAGALKGRPRPLHAHDWSDLPRAAAALRRERDALRGASAEKSPARCRACGVLLVEQTATHCWPRCQTSLRERVLDSLHVYHDFQTKSDGASEMYAYLRFVPEDMEPFRHGLSTGVVVGSDDRGRPLPDELRRAREKIADWMVAAWESLLEGGE